METDERQYIAIVQGDCDHLSGVGRGMLAGLEETTEWSFSGYISSVDHATLTINIEGSEETRTIIATQMSSGFTLDFFESNDAPRWRLSLRETCP